MPKSPEFAIQTQGNVKKIAGTEGKSMPRSKEVVIFQEPIGTKIEEARNISKRLKELRPKNDEISDKETLEEVRKLKTEKKRLAKEIGKDKREASKIEKDIRLANNWQSLNNAEETNEAESRQLIFDKHQVNSTNQDSPLRVF